MISYRISLDFVCDPEEDGDGAMYLPEIKIIKSINQRDESFVILNNESLLPSQEKIENFFQKLWLEQNPEPKIKNNVIRLQRKG